MKSRKKRLTEVYVWELPVRIYHWVNALCIVILCITGFIIADPPAILNASEAYFSYWFGIVRFIHFIAAFVFFFNFVFRLYWVFVGNRFARWTNFIPLKKSQWLEVLIISNSAVKPPPSLEVGSLSKKISPTRKRLRRQPKPLQRLRRNMNSLAL